MFKTVLVNINDNNKKYNKIQTVDGAACWLKCWGPNFPIDHELLQQLLTKFLLHLLSFLHTGKFFLVLRAI